MKIRSNVKNQLLAAAAIAVVIGGCAPANKSNTPAPLNTPADMWAELENAKGEVRRLNAKVEELNQQVQGNKQDPEMSRRVSRLEGNVTRLASQLAIDLDSGSPAQPAAQPSYGAAPQAAPQAGYAQAQPAYGAATATSSGAEDEEMPATTYNPGYASPAAQSPVIAPPPVAAQTQNTADAVYAKGLASFNARQYQQALGIFQEFNRNFKTSPLVANSLFWTGECYFQLGDFANAALSYQEVIEKFPKSAKHPDALFKRGAAFIKLGNAGAAKLSFKEVIDKYPDSAFAARAKSMMPK
jgi:tol-pal system protein YbgF